MLKKIVIPILCTITYLCFVLPAATQVFEKGFFEKNAYALPETSIVNPDPSSYIIIKSKPLQQYIEDMKSLTANGEYKKALSICNYLLDIAKDRSIKREVYLEKKEIKRLILEEKKKLRQEKKDKINQLHESGVSAYQAKDLGSAEKNFKELIEIDPDHSTANRYLQTYIPRRKQELAQAAQRAAERAAREKEEAAAKANRENINSLYAQGKSYYSGGDLDNAAQSFKEVLTLDPNHSAASKYLQTYIPRKQKELNKKKHIK
jgi:tetratricopeptide (TPR) repeat protein